MLQGVDLQHDIEARIIEGGQSLVKIELDDVHILAHTGQHIGVIDLDAVPAAAPLRLQIGQQAAVAAAQIQHPRTGRHQLRDRLHRALITHGVPPRKPAAIWSK